jgi:hypothetical protein
MLRWARYLAVVAAVCLVIAPIIVSGQTLARLRETNFVQRAGLRIEPGLSYTLGTNAKEFFQDYAQVLGGKSREFSTPVSGSLRISRHLDEYQSIGLVAGFTRTNLRENYDYDPRVVEVPLAPAQNVTQNMNIESIPLMVCYDLYPVDRQFTSYIGGSVGLGISHVQWYEDITVSRSPGARSKGERFDDWLYHLATELRAGVSLGFDGSTQSAVRSGIRIECAYRHIPVRSDFMRNVARSFPLPPPARLLNSYTLDIGGFAVHIGIMVVLRHK